MLLSGVRTFRKKSEILTSFSCNFWNLWTRFVLQTQAKVEDGPANEEYIQDPERYSIHLSSELYIDFEYYSHREVFEEMLGDFQILFSSTISRRRKYSGIYLTSFSPKLVGVSVLANEQDVLDLIDYTRGFGQALSKNM